LLIEAAFAIEVIVAKLRTKMTTSGKPDPSSRLHLQQIVTGLSEGVILVAGSRTWRRVRSRRWSIL
jgi:hypothetical protein